MDLNQTLENLRVSYQAATLDARDCLKEPTKQFDLWFENAVVSKCDEPNAFVLSTVHQNQPRARVVLLKGVDQGEFVFFTNYESHKGHEIEHNQNVALTFLWLPLHRQIRIEGTIQKVDAATSDTYFQKRPRGSQIGAVASPQSQKVNNREDLEKIFENKESEFSNGELIPRPAHWGGYKISPNFFEFWQGRDNRMHDRICYEKKNGVWEIYRVAP
jgi:pyridoxamine 5'-phosphate oxidase